jgi:hypothetical protein
MFPHWVHGVRPCNADIRLVKVRGLPTLYPRAKALKWNWWNRVKPSYMFQRRDPRGDARPLLELAPGLGGLRLDFLQRGRETPGVPGSTHG